MASEKEIEVIAPGETPKTPSLKRSVTAPLLVDESTSDMSDMSVFKKLKRSSTQDVSLDPQDLGTLILLMS